MFGFVAFPSDYPELRGPLNLVFGHQSIQRTALIARASLDVTEKVVSDSVSSAQLNFSSFVGMCVCVDDDKITNYVGNIFHNAATSARVD